MLQPIETIVVKEHDKESGIFFVGAARQAFFSSKPAECLVLQSTL
jgi:hypothetical protein